MHIRWRMFACCASASLMTGVLLAFSSPSLARLPDNRVYEFVSPIEKGGLSLLPNLAVTDPGGEHVIVDGGSKNSLLSSDASWMLETRTSAGWAGVQIGPSSVPEANYSDQRYVSLNAVSENFSRFAFQSAMALDPRDTTRGMGEYLREGLAAPFTWVTGPPAPALPAPEECVATESVTSCATNRAVFAGGSKSLKDVVWGQFHPLLAPPAALPGYPADTHAYGYEVYESVGGVAQLTGLVPAGPEPECGPSSGSCVVPKCGAAMGNEDAFRFPILGGFAPVQGAVSGDGSQVIFTSPDPSTRAEAGCVPPELYVRADGSTTVQVSVSARASGDPSGPKAKVYAGSSEEGGRINTVFFTSKEELTEDASTGNSDQGEDLYAYSMESGAKPGELVDLTPVNNTPGPSGGAEAVFLGSSTDGQLVYFTASSELTEQPNSRGETAKPGASNLYVYDATTNHTKFIAPGAGLAAAHVGTTYGISPTDGRLTSQLTPDGKHLVFVSSARLTAYNNFGPECVGEFSEVGGAQRGPGPCGEVYLYTATTGSLVCVSCNPSGAPPVGSARLPERFVENASGRLLEPGTLPAPRALSDDGGRVFFSSPDALTPEAPSPRTTIGPQAPMAINWEYEPNAYEYEAGGVNLIAPDAVVLTTTPSGKDVFFDTYSQLLPQDTDGSPDVYDARMDGGFPALAPQGCSGTSCQGNPAVEPIFATPASVTFSGPGDFISPTASSLSPKPKPKACRKGLVRKKGKCARKRKAKRASTLTRRGN